MDELVSDLIPIHTCNSSKLNDFALDNKCTQKLSIININIRGLKVNYPLLTSFLQQLNFCPTLIVITETHLCDDDDKLFPINGYKNNLFQSQLSGWGFTYIYKGIYKV